MLLCDWGKLWEGGFGPLIRPRVVTGWAHIALQSSKKGTEGFFPTDNTFFCWNLNVYTVIFIVQNKDKVDRWATASTSYSTFWSGAPRAPGEHGQPAELPRSPPCLHHYQLSLNSSDHHLNYPLSCPPDGFFANYNFSVDGQGIMTAEACAWVAGRNTEKAHGWRCGCKILLEYIHNALTKGRAHAHTQTPENMRPVPQLHRNSHRDIPGCWCTHTHTTHTYSQTPFPTSSCRKAIYWPSAEVSASKVNLRTCLMCSLRPPPTLFPAVALVLSEAERNSFTLQIQIHEPSGKMYSYHRWSYYGRGKLSNENIIHCKWHLNTYGQRERGGKKKVISSA